MNGALNRTVSDSRLSVRPITEHDRDAFELRRVVGEDRVPLELDGTTARLFVRLLVVVEDGRCRTESYTYRIQADESRKSWQIRWEYRRAQRSRYSHNQEFARPERDAIRIEL